MIWVVPKLLTHNCRFQFIAKYEIPRLDNANKANTRKITAVVVVERPFRVYGELCECLYVFTSSATNADLSDARLTRCFCIQP